MQSQPETPQIKSSRKLIVGIVILLIIMVGLIAAIILKITS